MKNIILAATALALVSAPAQAQLLGGGGLGGGLGGAVGGTLGGSIDRSGGSPLRGTLERTTRTVRGSVDAAGSTSASQSVDARRGTVAADRSASGSLTGSTASLADLVVPPASSMGSLSGSASGSGQGSANAQLIGTDAVRGAVAPVARGARSAVQDTTASTRNMGLAGTGSASGSGSGAVNGSLTGSPLALAGSTAAQGEGMASVRRGMPVMNENGASLGKVRQLIADGRGEVQQVVVKQGSVTRELPANMFSASGNALVVGQANGTAGAAGNDQMVEAE